MSKVVRVVGEEIEAEVMSLQDALKLADKWNSILLKFLQMQIPLFVKLLIIRNFSISKKKTERDKGKGCKIVVKEIRFGPEYR
jgi:translation initiation factor IF-3